MQRRATTRLLPAAEVWGSEPQAMNVIIMGAAGKDFHVFNTCYRENEADRVVAFTATQIPHIDDRRYPASIAGDPIVRANGKS